MASATDQRGWWKDFWAENEFCMSGHNGGMKDDDPIRPAFSSARPRVPVLVELGEDWVIERMGVNYKRFIQDFEFQQATRARCASLLDRDIGFRLKPKVDTSSLLHGSIYGNPIQYPENSTPWLEHIVKDPDEMRALIKRMEKTDVSQAGLVPWFVSCYRKLGKPFRWRILHDSTSVHGPATILAFLCGIDPLCLYLYDEPELLEDLLQLIGQVTVEYSRFMRKVTEGPASGVGIFDDVAGLVSPTHFERFFLPVYRRIYDELAPDPTDDRFLHNDARVGHLLDFLADLGVNGINPDPETAPRLIRRKLPNAMIYGCIPPLVLKEGSPHQVAEAARDTIRAVGDGGGLVLTAAGSINLGTPYDNLKAMCVAAERCGRYERGSLIG